MDAESRRPILLIANPVSGGRAGSPPGLSEDSEAIEPDALAAALRERGLEVTLHVLAESDDPAAFAARAVRAGRDVVVAGGDGTVGPVAGALVRSEATLGILATGSWNNIARGCRVPTDLEPALDAIAGGAAVLVDAVLAWHGADDEPAADATRFFEAAGVGLDAAGFGAIQLSERRGWWPALRALWRALRRRRTAIRLRVDDRTLRTVSPAVTICNGPYHGMGFALVPDADPGDGVLDVVVFSRMSQLETVRHFLAVARGRPRREPRVRVLRGTRVSVSGVRRTLPAHADGLSIGPTPVSFAVEPGVLRVFRQSSSVSA
jgi:diacylglycerol kinase (ATP)